MYHITEHTVETHPEGHQWLRTLTQAFPIKLGVEVDAMHSLMLDGSKFIEQNEENVETISPVLWARFVHQRGIPDVAMIQ